MAKTFTYTILSPGGNLTHTAQSDIYRYAVVVEEWRDVWQGRGLHRDMRSAMESARGLMDVHHTAKVVEAVLTAIDGVPIPGAVEQRVQEKVDRLDGVADRIWKRAEKSAPEARKQLIHDFIMCSHMSCDLKALIKKV